MVKNHYNWLEENLGSFMTSLGADVDMTLIICHGDKAYRDEFEKAGIDFYHGVAIYLISHVKPFSNECRDTDSGWIPVIDWIVVNKERFLSHLKPI